MDPITVHHLIRNEDLNHHNTLFAGRIAEWIIEAGFIAATDYLKSHDIVCVDVNDICFLKPVHCGDIVRLDAGIVHTGTTSVITHITMSVDSIQAAEGFITFVNIDENGKSMPHGHHFEAATDEEKALEERALAIFARRIISI